MNEYVNEFIKTYNTIKNEYKKLEKIVIKMEAGVLDENLSPKCDKRYLIEQKRYLGEALRIMQIRSEIEKIDLNY